MTLRTTPDFDFLTAVCSHGFFMLAPNAWDAATRTLHTTIGLNDERAVTVAIRAAVRSSRTRGGTSPDDRPVAARDVGPAVTVTCPASLSPQERSIVRESVARMLRLDEGLAPFHRLCRRSKTHRAAARMRFGRLLRSATLFEDVVKVICTCNVTWRQTTAMAERLTRRSGPIDEQSGQRAFPTPGRLARLTPRRLRVDSGLGYRAEYVQHFARDVSDGRTDLSALENHEGDSDTLYRAFRGLHGIGDYAASHLCMLLGHYDRLPVDTELRRFLKDRDPARTWTPAAIRDEFAAWHPWQFLAYWFELWRGYTDRHGASDQWSPEGVGRRITTPSDFPRGSHSQRDD
jgi:3-methyladenine DNA glycosylase/8-oxoguanine DNA glycosylase